MWGGNWASNIFAPATQTRKIIFTKLSEKKKKLSEQQDEEHLWAGWEEIEPSRWIYAAPPPP